EFNAFDIPLADSRSIFLEQLDLMQRAWTENDFTFQGEHYRVPSPTTVLPKPLQQPHPPIWVATTSLSTLDWIAQVGYHALLPGNILSWDELGAWRDRLDVGRAAAGHGEAARLGALRHVFCTETEEEARAAVWQTRWQRRISYHLGHA